MFQVFLRLEITFMYRYILIVVPILVVLVKIIQLFQIIIIIIKTDLFTLALWTCYNQNVLLIPRMKNYNFCILIFWEWVVFILVVIATTFRIFLTWWLFTFVDSIYHIFKQICPEYVHQLDWYCHKCFGYFWHEGFITFLHRFFSDYGHHIA